MPGAELCVIFNPAAGRGRAARRLDLLSKRCGARAVFKPTSRPGHALELARQAAEADFRIIAAAGGDGTVHEVANGILEACRTDCQPGNPDPRTDCKSVVQKPALGIIPIGSANDYYASLQLEPPPDGVRERPVDVGVVRGPNGRSKFFICCLGLGFNGLVTIESRKIKRLQGVALYGLATLRTLWSRFACPRMQVAIDQAPIVETPTLSFSVLVGRREGGFILAPKACLCDGWLDYMHVGAISRLEIVRFLPSLALAGPPTNHPKVRQGRCQKVTLKCEAPLAVHIDGELFAVPEDGVRSIEIEVLPSALRVVEM